MKANCTCLVCGTKYYFCPTCNHHSITPKPIWMKNYCGENCKSISDLFTSYRLHKLTNEEIKGKLSTIDLSNRENYTSAIQKFLLEIENTETDVVE